jgi:transcription antitermination factor NusG
MGRRCKYGVKSDRFDGSEIQKRLGLLKKVHTERKPLIDKSPDDFPRSLAEKYKPEDPDSRWIIVELSEDAVLEEHLEHIERGIHNTLGQDAAYFIPIYKEKVRSKGVCLSLSEGWIYVKRTDEVMQKIRSLKGDHIRGPFISGGYLREVTGEYINFLKKEMQDRLTRITPKVGQTVIPQVGTFRNVRGEVLSVNKKKLTALVLFKKASRIVRAPVNIINLVFGDKDEND